MTQHYKTRWDSGKRGVCPVMEYCEGQKTEVCMHIERHPHLHRVISCFNDAYKAERRADEEQNPGLMRRIFGDLLNPKKVIV